jgi:hypothetical protein
MMRGIAAGITAALLLAGTSAFARDSYVPGPEPDWADYKALGEAALREKLPNADQWKVEWPYGYIQGKWRHKGSFQGYLTCGLLRTDTPFDGRTVIQFLTVIDHGVVQTADIGQKDPKSAVNYWCGIMISKGVLRPASLIEPSEFAIARLGLTVRPMPEGAYVVSATDGAPARTAGITAGMVLTRANNIPLAGMGTAIGSLLDGDATSWTLETATGDRFEVGRPR